MKRIRRFPALVALPLLATGGCGSANPYDSLYETQQASEVRQAQDAFAKGYFPQAIDAPQLDCSYPGGPLPIVSGIEADWYPRQWEAAKEPSLYWLSEQEPAPEFAFRFSYVPSFTPSIFIRVHKVGGDYRLTAKKMSGTGGYDPGAISRSKEIRLSVQQVGKLERLLSNGFFNQPPITCDSGFDGSRWILEMVSENEYKMVNRWSPAEGSVRVLGEYLVSLSGWKFDAS